MGKHLLPGDPAVELTLRRSPRARRISLRVSGLDGKVTLTLPRGVAEAEALAFAREKAGWLRAQLGARPEAVMVRPGVEFPVEGENLRIIPGDGRRIEVADGQLHVPGEADRIAARLKGWLKQRARDRLAQMSDKYAAALDRPYTRITLRDTRSRWGSCSAGGGLMFSWRLIMAPPDVLDYVAAHEVAHLAEMNHSPAFWALVHDLCPAHDAPRRWLRRNGAELHRYRFDD